MTLARGGPGRARRLFALLAILALVGACSGGGGGDAADEPVEAERGQPILERPPDVGDAEDEDTSTSDDPSDPGAGPPTPSVGDDDRPVAAGAFDTEVPDSRERVIAWAEELLASAVDEADEDAFTVLVVDEAGREVLAHGPDEPVVPASTLKIVTAAAALLTFGPDATFTTRVDATAPLDEDGVLDGDLVFVGSGDPVLSTDEYARWVYPARPRTPLEDLADAVAASGVTEVTGDLVGLADRFDGPMEAEGWPDRYFADLDARYASGLTIDAGLRTLLSYPDVEDDEADDGADGDDADDGAGDDGDGDGRDREDGAEAAAGRDDAAARDGEDGDADAGDGDGDGDSAEDDPASDDADGDGEDDDPPPDVDPIVRVDHATDPAAHAVAELARLLEERDVEVAGELRTGEVDGTVVGRLGQVESPPLDELLTFAVQRSDNQITDALFKAVGRARTGTGSFASGDQALRQVLERFEIDHADAHFADGSGLSRDDRATARLLVDLDRSMLATRHARTWVGSMAVTGRSGTLEGRLADTVADGRFVGKTGTLRDVTGLVGHATGHDGRRYHLAVVANDPGGGRWIARTLADELIQLLVADLDGCAVDEGAGGDNVLGRPPIVVSC